MRIPLDTSTITPLATATKWPVGPEPVPDHPGETPIAAAPTLAFRHHKDVNPEMWGKKVPTYDSGGTRWYFLTYRLIVPHQALMFLAPGAEPRLEDQCQEVLDHYRRIISQDLDRVRKRAILHFVNHFLARMGLESVDAIAQVPKTIVEAVALMFDVGQTTVQKLLPKPTEKPDVSHKKDERWAAVKSAAQLARVYAHKLPLTRPLKGGGPVAGPMRTDDVLVKFEGKFVYPQVCPVLNVELTYDFFMDRKSPRLIRVGRIDPTKPFETGNVMLMSTKAFYAVETRSGAKPKLSMVLTSDEQEAFDAWCRKHGV